MQTFPSLHAVPLVAGVVVQTPLSQASVVHGFPSWHWALLVHPPAPPELEPLELPLLNPLELPDPLELPELEPLELLAPLELPELLDAPELDPLELAPLELPELAPSEASAASASASLAPASTPESSLGTQTRRSHRTRHQGTWYRSPRADWSTRRSPCCSCPRRNTGPAPCT